MDIGTQITVALNGIGTIKMSEEIIPCYNCKMREAKPYLCTHCQWNIVSDSGLLKKLGDGKLRLGKGRKNEL